MAYCLIKSLADKVTEKLKSGEINPEKLISMTSEERRAYFAEFLGEENAKSTNALLESKLLLKNQQAGLVNWAKTITGLKPEYKRDILAKVEKMDRVLNPAEYDSFLNDLAEKRLGFSVTEAEANSIFDLSQGVKDTRVKIDRNSPSGSLSRMDYGISLVNFQNFIRERRLDAERKTIAEMAKPGNLLISASGLSKSVMASLDNSFFGRQGWKVIFDDPKSWTKAYLKSWGDMKDAMKGGDPIDLCKAEVYSRENAINGTYQKMKLDIGIEGEEAFPSALPERIPLLGRLFKASEQAFNGAAVRLRAYYADRVLEQAQRGGVDISDKTMLEGYGKLVNSMTGRGNIGSLESQGKWVNATLFSAKFLKSNLDTLTAHVFDKDVPLVVKKKAATNLVKIVAGTSSILFLAKMINPDSVNFDPRSSDLGKIKIGNTRISVGFGAESIITLASRLTDKFYTSYIKGEKTGYGQTKMSDLLLSFAGNKLSPLAGIVRDYLREATFDYQKPTILKEASGLVIPIPVQTAVDLWNDRENSSTIAGFLYQFADFSGLSTNTYVPKKKGAFNL